MTVYAYPRSGLILFLGLHFVPALPEVRLALVTRLGRTALQAAFSLLSLLDWRSSSAATHRRRPARACSNRRGRHRGRTVRDDAVVHSACGSEPAQPHPTHVGHPMLLGS